MEDSSEEPEEHPPRWVPYTPPPPEGWERVQFILRRLSFPFALLLLGLGVAGIFYVAEQRRTMQRDRPSVNVMPGTEANRDAVDSATPPVVTIESLPSGATVRVNGDSLGTTPLTDSSLQSGVYFLSLKAPGHFRVDTVLVLEDSMRSTLRLSLRPRPSTRGVGAQTPGTPTTSPDTGLRAVRPPPTSNEPPPPDSVLERAPTGSLLITSVPSGAVVSIGQTSRGQTPLAVGGVRPGQTSVTVQQPGYETWTSQVDVRADSTHRIHARLERSRGRLRVLARPWGTIYIGGELHAREADVWYETQLPVGRHEVRVVHPVLGEQTRTVTVRATEETSVVVNLRTEEQGNSPE